MMWCDEADLNHQEEYETQKIDNGNKIQIPQLAIICSGGCQVVHGRLQPQMLLDN